MKKIILHICLLVFLLALWGAYPIHAAPSCLEDGSCVVEIAENGYKVNFLPELEAKIAPTPAQDEKFVTDDNRSWTHFAYKDLIQSTAKKYDLDPQLIYATIMTESEGNKYAYRYEPHLKEPSLCMGQILISTAKNLGFEGHPLQIYDPEICIDLIGKYHRAMLDEYGNLTPAQLAKAYNSGSPWKRAVWGHVQRFMDWFNS